MAKKMRVHSGGKHKVMSALASVSGLGELGAARSKHSKDYRKMRYEIDFDLFGAAEARRRLSETDPQVQLAITLFPEAQRLSEMAKAPGKQAAR